MHYSSPGFVPARYDYGYATVTSIKEGTQVTAAGSRLVRPISVVRYPRYNYRHWDVDHTRATQTAEHIIPAVFCCACDSCIILTMCAL